MTVYFHETFTGESALQGSAPDVSFTPSVYWGPPVNAYVIKSGGYMQAPTASADFTMGQCTIGNTAATYGVTGPVEIEFTFKVIPGPGLSNGRVGLKFWADGQALEFGMISWATSAIVFATGKSDVDVTGVFVPGNTYTVVFHLESGASSVTMLGNTFTFGNVFNGSTGVNQLLATVTKYSKIDSIKISSVSVPAAAIGAGPAVLGAPRVLGASVDLSLPRAMGAAPAVLGAPRVRVLHDFTGVLGDARSVYVMDLATPTGAVRVPVSSWQATLQTGSSNYVQCVVPACTGWQVALDAATEFVIYRRAVLPGGSAVEQEMARAPASTLQYDRGPGRHTCTLSGYSTAFVADAAPDAAYDRTLTGVRSMSSGGSMRVRCAVDWLLRPGQRAWVQGTPMLVGYINYYSPSGFDSYMDVGEQA